MPEIDSILTSIQSHPEFSLIPKSVSSIQEKTIPYLISIFSSSMVLSLSSLPSLIISFLLDHSLKKNDKEIFRVISQSKTKFSSNNEIKLILASFCFNLSSPESSLKSLQSLSFSSFKREKKEKTQKYILEELIEYFSLFVPSLHSKTFSEVDFEKYSFSEEFSKSFNIYSEKLKEIFVAKRKEIKLAFLKKRFKSISVERFKEILGLNEAEFKTFCGKEKLKVSRTDRRFLNLEYDFQEDNKEFLKNISTAIETYQKENGLDKMDKKVVMKADQEGESEGESDIFEDEYEGISSYSGEDDGESSY